jgi:hypothetical protein
MRRKRASQELSAVSLTNANDTQVQIRGLDMPPMAANGIGAKGLLADTEDERKNKSQEASVA